MSLLGNKALIQPSSVPDEQQTIQDNEESESNLETEQVTTEEVKQESSESTEENKDKSETNLQETDNSVEIGSIFVTSSPKQDSVTKAFLSSWDEEKDRDIVGNTYPTAMKLSVYNMIYAMGGGASHIIADVHIPFGEKANVTWTFSFVVAKDMVGNGSSAEITIFSGEEEIVPTFTLESTTTEEISYDIDLTGIRDLIIRFDCNAVDGGFCAGIILEE